MKKAQHIEGTMIILAILSIMILISVTRCSDCGWETNLENIYSLKVLGSSQGSFFLGTGGTMEVPMYYFYVKEGPGYILRKVRADRTIIQESKGDPSFMTYDCSCYGGSLLSSTTGKCEGEWKKDVLTVPTGTIYFEYDGELK